MGGVRGVLAGALVLAAVEVVVTTSQKAGGGTDPLGTLTTNAQGQPAVKDGLIGSLSNGLERFLNPSVPLFGPTSSTATKSSVVLASSTVAQPGSSSSEAAQVVAGAQAELGKPYQWGGVGPDSFDCSGLIDFLYGEVGVNTTRTTYTQVEQGTPVDTLADALPGDVVFFNEGTGNPPEHEGLYVGGGQMIDAPDTGGVVREEPVWPNVYAIRRFAQTQLPPDAQGVAV